jgi:regulator of RNase E activity RraA
MTITLTPSQLETLRNITAPTIANAIETFDIQSRNVGFMGPEIKCVLPSLGNMIGYACTAVISARSPAFKEQGPTARDLWEHALSLPEPRVVVIKDLDYPNAIGSFWGEVNGNVHKALGCVGTVTDGGVRDLDEVEELGFHFFASEVLVSHAYVHLEAVGCPVTVGGIEVRPGDLIHGDKHGVISIPSEIAPRIADASQQMEDWERPIIDFCKSQDFNMDKLQELMSRPRPSNSL